MKLRRRIVLSMLSVIVVSGLASTAIGAYLIWRHLRREAEARVRQDLSAAQEFYDQRLAAMAEAVGYTALGERFAKSVADGDIAYLAPRLQAVAARGSIDVLFVTDPNGRIIHRHGHGRGDGAGASAADDPLLAAVLDGGRALTATLLVPRQAASAGGGTTAPASPPATAPASRPADDSTLMLCAAAPVHGPGGRLVGALRAGVFLAGDRRLVDQVQNTVFRGESYRGKPLGVATIFQQDVRIATNAVCPDGSCAVGTGASGDVAERVLHQGRTYLGETKIAGDWCLSAYAPLRDMAGRPVGMLAVAVQEARFRDAALGTWWTFALVTLAGLLAASLVAWKLAQSLSRPVASLVVASQAVARGRFDETVPATSTDELNALARAFNAMADSLRQRDELLQHRTRLQLTRSERLAAVGRLTAGIAHEINNPLTGALTFAHMLLRDAAKGSQQKEDIETIIEATTRCRDIIRGLLNFSRQNEPRKKRCDLNAVLREALNLTGNQARLAGVAIEADLADDLGELVIDPAQIQEVAVNVILNAIDAMPDGGTLRVRSRRAAAEGDAAGGAEFEIGDSGLGIPADDLERIFDPFYTTKPPGKGTGLGLAISYGIVSEHGGDIRIASQPARGTTVIVRLPAPLKEGPDEQARPDPRGR